MRKWIEFQEANYKTSTDFVKKKPTQALIDASENVLRYTKQNQTEYNVHPIIPAAYVSYAKQYNDTYGAAELPDGYEKMILDPRYTDAINAPMREIHSRSLPDRIVKPAFDALKEQESVFNNLMLFRLMLLRPGDNTILHYDPKALYTSSNEWFAGEYRDMQAFLFMHDQEPGQISWLGDSEVKYEQYDMFVFEREQLLHGAINFGYHNRYMLCYAWAEPL